MWALYEWNNKNHHRGTYLNVQKTSFDEGTAGESSSLKIWRIITEDTSANTLISRKAHEEVHFFGEIWRITESLMVT